MVNVNTTCSFHLVAGPAPTRTGLWSSAFTAPEPAAPSVPAFGFRGSLLCFHDFDSGLHVQGFGFGAWGSYYVSGS